MTQQIFAYISHKNGTADDSAFDFTADFNDFIADGFNLVDQRRIRHIKHGGQHAADLGSAVIRLRTG